MNKKLVWFNTGLLSLYNKNTDDDSYKFNYYLGKKVEPLFYDTSRVEWHIKMSRVVQRAICLVDSTRISEKYGDGLNMARTVIPYKNADIDNGAYVDSHFDDLAYSRVDAIYDHAEKQNYKEIRISWSGGIDSNFALAAIFKHPRSKPWIKDKKISIWTSYYAKNEEPSIWNWIIKNDLPIHFINYEQLAKDKSPYLFVTGDGDPWGSTFFDLHANFVDKSQLSWGHWTLLKPFFLSRDKTGLTWDYFQELIRSSTVPIESCFHAWWWFECCTTQDFVYRMASYNQEPISEESLPGKKIFWFFHDQGFFDHSLFSLLKNKINNDNRNPKLKLIEYIANWQSWDKNKTLNKFFSQRLIPKRIYKWKIYEDLSWDRDIKL